MRSWVDHIDVQYGEGFLNYIIGYTSKASDAMDFRLDQHIASDASYQWRTCYRLLCKQVMCVPEIMAKFASLPLMIRSFHVEPVVTSTPKRGNAIEHTDSGRQYLAYLRHWCGVGSMPLRVVSLSFMSWLRRYSTGPKGVRARPSGYTLAIGVRFAFEMLDVFVGQYAAIFLPHYEQGCFEAAGEDIMQYTAFFVGVLRYLRPSVRVSV